MTMPRDWHITYTFNNTGSHFAGASDVRGVCPHCRLATTFLVRSVLHDIGTRTKVYLVLLCNYTPCRKTVYVETSVQTALGDTNSNPQDPFFLHPPGTIEAPHASVPTEIADDWLEAQRSLAGGNPKAAAVMLRRVLYGVLMDKGCKLHPLRDGMQDLITGQRLPGIFDDWLPAFRDDGHDGAHPDRSLKVSTENVTETMEYTSELLHYLYIEPYEFQQRKARNAAAPATP
jgi:Domain of unknown function (DUF4145)